MKTPFRIFIATILFAATLAGAAETPESKPDPDRLEWFRDAKFGMFIHWGLYSIPAGEWKGSTMSEVWGRTHGAWIQCTANIPCAEYDTLAEQLNPVKFDAKEWVRIAKDAGYAYIVYTAKHHDGFSMYDSRYTDFDIVDASPYGKDPLKELAEACQEVGIKLCIYYSLPDWHHPEFPAEYSQRNSHFHGQPKKDADLSIYNAFMRDQVRELLTNYGPIGLLWFDAGGAFRGVNKAEILEAQKMVDMIHELQPDCLVNDRIGLPGDYGTPEQHIPAGEQKRPFEVCMTIGNKWAYNKNDKAWKPTKVLLGNLVDIASKGGNYLLNVGPTAEGVILPSNVERLKAMGDWLKVNGEAIYGAGPTAFGYEVGTAGKKKIKGKPGEVELDKRVTVNALNWRCTTKPGKLYIHLLKWPEGPFEITEMKDKATKAYLLADPKQTPLDFSQEGKSFKVTLPENAPDPYVSVMCIEIED